METTTGQTKEFEVSIKVTIRGHECYVKVSATTLEELFKKVGEVVEVAEKYKQR